MGQRKRPAAVETRALSGSPETGCEVPSAKNARVMLMRMGSRPNSGASVSKIPSTIPRTNFRLLFMACCIRLTKTRSATATDTERQIRCKCLDHVVNDLKHGGEFKRLTRQDQLWLPGEEHEVRSQCLPSFDPPALTLRRCLLIVARPAQSDISVRV
jgi:hypothetical protein